MGTLIRTDLAEHGVDVVDRAGPLDQPAVSTVLVTRGTGQRAVVSVGPPQGRLLGGDRLPETDGWAAGVVDGVDAVLVDGHHLDLALPVAAAARTAGIPVLLDGGSWKRGLERLLGLIDIAVVSAVFCVPGAAGRSGSAPQDVLAAVSALGPPVVARSHGPHPIEVLTGAGRTQIPVPRVEVVDTLGAGDVLHGALLAWLGARGADGVIDAVAWAAGVASDSCAAPGARGWLADGDRVAGRRHHLAGA